MEEKIIAIINRDIKIPIGTIIPMLHANNSPIDFEINIEKGSMFINQNGLNYLVEKTKDGRQSMYSFDSRIMRYVLKKNSEPETPSFKTRLFKKYAEQLKKACGLGVDFAVVSKILKKVKSPYDLNLLSELFIDTNNLYNYYIYDNNLQDFLKDELSTEELQQANKILAKAKIKID